MFGAGKACCRCPGGLSLGMFYAEQLGAGRSFNLWEHDGGRYYSVGTLLHEDPACGTQWSVTPKDAAVSYDPDGLEAELESPLVVVPEAAAREMLAATSPEAVVEMASHIQFPEQGPGI